MYPTAVISSSVNARPSSPQCNLEGNLSDRAAELSVFIEHLRDDIARRLPLFPARDSEHRAWTNLENGYVALETGAAQLRVVVNHIRREGL